MRAKEKLLWALDKFDVQVEDKVAADFGSAVGGFVAALLARGAKKVYAVETGYGLLAWSLRNDPRVIVKERCNAMYLILPEKVEVITIDVGWTKQEKILPNAIRNLKPGGQIVSLIKPHYELGKAVLSEEERKMIVKRVRESFTCFGLEEKGWEESPLLGQKGSNKEYLAWLVVK